MKTLDDVDQLAAEAHSGQTDKIGVPYIEHVRGVAAGLVSFGPDLQMAGLLHDVIEDTEWTAERLLAAGVPQRVINTVVAVTNGLPMSYEQRILHIASRPEATLVKIADNAHNCRPDRTARLAPEQRERLSKKYAAARAVLWPAVDPENVEAIISIVNPALLAELRHKTVLAWE